jgi:thymidylate synthase (FAD)
MEPIEIKVLDKGFVRLIDFMGGDETVVLAARVSTGKGLKGEEQDRKLINYLMKHRHETPFEHSVFQFHISCPLFVARQWLRHRVASYNERSGRYVEYEDEFYLPDRLRLQAKSNKQASEFGEIPNERELIQMIQETYELVYERYKKLLASGVARELARAILPLSLYTQFYWTINARSLMNFINLRADASAQWEIRQYAEAIAKIFKAKMPWTWEAFVQYVWRGRTPRFSRDLTS